MADTITEEDVQKIIPDAVRQAYAEEAVFIATTVRVNRETGESWIQQALTWVPYIDEVFEEQEIDIAAATSAIDRPSRVRVVIDKIEKGLGFALDQETKDGVRADVWQMYEKTMDTL
jgi:hypothetical protein